MTNDPEHGIDPLMGLSPVRQDYLNSWRGWQATAPDDALRLGLADGVPRAFEAPPAMIVPAGDVQRNFGAERPESLAAEAVTAICVSKRPHFLSHIAETLKAQTYPLLHVIYVAHGDAHDLNAVRQAFAGLANFTLLQLREEGSVLADGLNLALSECATDLVAKIDDDDFYGPDYLTNMVLALKHAPVDDIGLIGKGAHFCYVESKNQFGLRFAMNKANRPALNLHGGTLLWRRSVIGNLTFERVRQGTDSAFARAVTAMGLKLYSADPYDFVHIRYADTGDHTWRIEDEEFMRPVKVAADGLRLDLAYSRQMQGEYSLPKRPGMPTAAPTTEKGL